MEKKKKRISLRVTDTIYDLLLEQYGHGSIDKGVQEIIAKRYQPSMRTDVRDKRITIQVPYEYDYEIPERMSDVAWQCLIAEYYGPQY